MADSIHISETVSAGQLRAFIERIERVEEEIKTLNADKSEIYKELRGCGFDVKAVRQCVAARKLDSAEREERNAIFDLYWSALTGSVHVHTPARENIEKFDPETGEIHDADSEQHVGRQDGEQRGQAPVQSADRRGEIADDGDQGQGAGASGADRGVGSVEGEFDCQDQDGGSRHVGGEVDHEVTPSDGGAIVAVKAQGRLTNVTDVEPSPSVSHSNPQPTSSPEADKTGEVATPLPASPVSLSDADVPTFLKKDKPRKSPADYRPHCQRPEACGSSGLHHCYQCQKALDAEAVPA